MLPEVSAATVGIVIPTLNGANDLSELLPAVLAEPGCKTVLVLDSNSSDNTADVVARFPNVQLRKIPRADFNHGATRELGRRTAGTDIVVFLTQDVVPVHGWLQSLVAPIKKGESVVSYGRQLPRQGADILEAFPRSFNYPAESERRTLADAKARGVYTFFCSNSCAAYLNRALDEIGGFEAVLTNEDYFAVARLLGNGGAIMYAADAQVYHSHRYSLKQEFQRYFDNGYVRGERPWVQALVGSAEHRGASMMIDLGQKLARNQPWLIPRAFLQACAKWLGYRVGFYSTSCPRWWKRSLSGQKYYWTKRANAQSEPPRTAGHAI